MSTYDDYRTIDVTIDGANDYPAQIIVSTGDTDGRRIRAKFLVDGTPVTDATGAAIYYGNDNVPADSVTMTEETDGVYTGVIPTAAYAGKACATVTVGLKKGASIVMSRSIRLIIDHAFGDDAPDNIDGGQLEDAINRAETAADAAEDSATAAKNSETNAKNSANSAASSASTAESAKNSASASAIAAKASETNAKTSENNARNSASAAKTSETNAKTSETNAKTSETKAAQSAKTAQTAAETAQEIADNFGVTASATASEPGGAASVNVTKKGTSYDLAFTIPRGAQGPKGDPGDAFDAHFNETIVGDGSSGNPYRVADGTMITITAVPENTDLNTVIEAGVYELISTSYQNLPDNMTSVRGFLMVYKKQNHRFVQIAVINTNVIGQDYRVVNDVYVRSYNGSYFEPWEKLAKTSDIPAAPIFDASTIIGNGSSGNPYKVKNGTLMNPVPWSDDTNVLKSRGAYFINYGATNLPYSDTRGILIVYENFPSSRVVGQFLIVTYGGEFSKEFSKEIWQRVSMDGGDSFDAWTKIAPTPTGMTSVVTDNTTISGNGTTSKPLKLAYVAADGDTILGNGTSSNKLKLANGTAITPEAVTGSGQDLNNYVQSGIYYVDITNCANTPISGQAGRLIVIKGGNNVSQLFHNTQQNRFFTRAKTASWSPWVEFTSSTETWPKFSELRSNLQLVALSETRGLLIFQGGIVPTNSNGIGNISLISSSYTITPRNTPSWYGTVIVNQNTVETARFVTSSGNIQITAKASSSIQIAPFTLMVNLS